MAAKKQGLPITQIVIFIVVIAIVILIIKKVIMPQDTTTDTTTTGTATGSTSAATSSATPVDPGNVTIKYGSSGEAVKLTQQRLNELINLCKAAYDSQKSYPNMSATTMTRINKIAVWDKLATDGKYGSKTKALVTYVMGTEITTLNKVRAKYNDFQTAINS